MNLTKYFNLARDVSHLSDYRKNIKIGAVIVYKKKIIGSGYNSTKTNPIQMKYNKLRETLKNADDIKNRTFSANDHLPSCHAEISALISTRGIDIDYNKASIFIYRESSDGKMRNCRPCLACMRALKDKGIKNIYYTNEDGLQYERI